MSSRHIRLSITPEPDPGADVNLAKMRLRGLKRNAACKGFTTLGLQFAWDPAPQKPPSPCTFVRF